MAVVLSRRQYGNSKVKWLKLDALYDVLILHNGVFIYMLYTWLTSMSVNASINMMCAVSQLLTDLWVLCWCVLCSVMSVIISQMPTAQCPALSAVACSLKLQCTVLRTRRRAFVAATPSGTWVHVRLTAHELLTYLTTDGMVIVLVYILYTQSNCNLEDFH